MQKSSLSKILNKLFANKSAVLLMLVLLSAISIIAGIKFALGTDFSEHIVAEFKAENTSVSTIKNTLYSVDRFVKVELLEEFNFRVSFATTNIDEIKAKTQEAIDSSVGTTEIEFFNSKPSFTLYNLPLYILSIVALIIIFSLYLYFSNTEVERALRRRIIILQFKETFILLLLIFGVAFLPSLIGLNRFEVVTLSMVIIISALNLLFIYLQNIFIVEFNEKYLSSDLAKSYVNFNNTFAKFIKTYLLGFVLMGVSIFILSRSELIFNSLTIVLLGILLYFYFFYIKFFILDFDLKLKFPRPKLVNKVQLTEKSKKPKKKKKKK